MMRFDRRFFVVLSASLLWALVVSAFFYRMAAGSGRPRTEARKTMVVATRLLATGAAIGRDEVRLREVPESFFPAGGFSRLEDVVDRPVISPIEPDEPVLAARVADKGSGMGLAPLIPAGMRALAVRVNDVAGVAGFILPGMRVDVLVTGRELGGNDTVTRTALQNVAVLSAGQTIQTDGKSQSIQVPVVTLLVNPRQAETLTLANSEGKVQLVLRNSADARVEATPGSRMRDLFASGRMEDPPPAPIVARPPLPVLNRTPEPAPALLPPAVAPAPPKPPQDAVEVIQGKLRTVEFFPMHGGSK